MTKTSTNWLGAVLTSAPLGRGIDLTPLVLAGGLLVVVLGGCSSSETVEVAGTVSWDGKPLPDGEIVFVAHDGRSTVGAG